MSQHGSLHWRATQIIQLANLLEVCRLDLCLSCLPRLLETGEDKLGLQGYGLQAATRIVLLQRQNPSKVSKKFWGTTASLIAAGVFLILDLICFRSTKSDIQEAGQPETVNYCIQILEDAATSQVNGSIILKGLLHFYSVGLAGGVVDKHTLLRVMNLAAKPIVNSEFMGNELGLETNQSNVNAESVHNSHQNNAYVRISEQDFTTLESEFDSTRSWLFRRRIRNGSRLPKFRNGRGHRR